MKQWYKSVVVLLLSWQVRRLQAKRSFATVGVVGSVGKTSTKQAIAQYLGSSYRVRYQEGNYNDLVSVPLVYFGLALPSLYNPLAWMWRFIQIEIQLWQRFPFDVVVLELGTDGPGQIEQFSRYMRCDVAVVSAITPEHMENFSDLQAVADEELSVRSFADALIVNADAVDSAYRETLGSYHTYGTSREDTVQVTSHGQQVTIRHGQKSIRCETKLVGEHMHLTLGAAYAVSHQLGLHVDKPKQALREVSAMPGRMRMLNLAGGATAIDDTYNASPEAMYAALQVLRSSAQPKKIAVLGNMNELGGHSQAEHESVGAYCDPEVLDELIVIGKDAKAYLAPAAEKRGVRVSTFDSPYAIADYLKPRLSKDVIVLFKGSQNGVFLEEAIKPLLQHPRDARQLVRQSSHWRKRKFQQFSHI